MRRAAMLYKTEPFVNGQKDHHTNNWEIVEAIRILNSFGFSVDLIDRNHHNWSPSEKFDLFLGLGAGGSGINYARYARASQSPIKVLLAMGPHPDVSEKRVIERYSNFNSRNNMNAPPQRLVSMVSGTVFQDFLSCTDYIMCIGEEGNESYKSYSSHGKIVLPFFPGVSREISFSPHFFKTRHLSHFLCFAGNGLICKGVDLLVEAFAKTPAKTLHICGPKTEAPFFSKYDDIINNSPNIHYHGFISPSSKEFLKLAGLCSYVIFHSAAEGLATSVATAMRAGLVPVLNSWSGIIHEDFGVPLEEEGDLIENVIAGVKKTSLITPDSYREMVFKTLNKSLDYTQSSFTHSYSSCILKILENENSI